VGVCHFCGRATCEDHIQINPYILELFRSAEMQKALVVEDAVWCGTCKPRPDPIELPELG
jgi:hypothetical protein